MNSRPDTPLVSGSAPASTPAKRANLVPHALMAVLLLAIAVAIIWYGLRFATAFDVTANHRHQLSEPTRNAANALQGPIELIGVVPPGVARQQIETLVERYRAVRDAPIELHFINPDTDPAAVRALDAAPDGELIVRAEGREQRLREVSERALTGALRQLGLDGTRRIAFVSGHDEAQPFGPGPDGWQSITGRLDNVGLRSELWSLVTAPVFDEDIDVVVLAAPRRAFFPGEVASLLQYVNRGGNLLWLQEGGVSGTAGNRLDPLALELGVEWLPGQVIDAPSQEAGLAAPDHVVLDRLPRHPITAGLRSPVLIPQARALAVTPLAGQRLLALLQTGEQSWTETGELTGAVGFDADTEEQAGPLLLGVTIERQIGEREQRIAVLGDADLATNAFVGTAGNQAFMESLMLWLTGDADALSFVTQPAPDATLQLAPAQIFSLSGVWLGALPLGLLFGAFMAWRARR